MGKHFFRLGDVSQWGIPWSIPYRVLVRYELRLRWAVFLVYHRATVFDLGEVVYRSFRME